MLLTEVTAGFGEEVRPLWPAEMLVLRRLREAWDALLATGDLAPTEAP